MKYWKMVGFYVCLGLYFSTLLMSKGTSEPSTAKSDVNLIFEQKYNIWIDYIKSEKIGSSRIHDYTQNAAFKEIVALGVPALPLIMEKIEHEYGLVYGCMSIAASQILRHKAKKLEPVRIWWNTGRLEIPKEFETNYKGWLDAEASGDRQKSEAAIKAIEGLGTLAIPLIQEKIAAGKNKLIPIISRLTDGAVKSNATKEQVVAWWAKDKAKWTLPEKKKPETAPAPAPQSATAPAAWGDVQLRYRDAFTIKTESEARSPKVSVNIDLESVAHWLFDHL